MSLTALVLVGTCIPGQHQPAHRAHQQGGQPAARHADPPPPEPEQHNTVELATIVLKYFSLVKAYKHF